MRCRLLAWNRKRLELKLADLEHHRGKWGWSYKPSDWAYVEGRIAKLRAKLASGEVTG